MNLPKNVAAGIRIWLPALLFVLLQPVVTAYGQQEEPSSMKLRLRRDLGFGFSSLVRGNFSILVDAPDEVVGVRFLIDGSEIGESRERPFRWRFNTADYPDGTHRISAEGLTSAGAIIGSNTLSRRFVSSVPTFLVVGALLFLVVVFRAASFFIANRGTKMRMTEKYGYLGGTVCQNCNRPFGIHWWSIRLVGVRFDRCPHCGSWKSVSRVSNQLLAAAEISSWLTESETQGISPKKDDSSPDSHEASSSPNEGNDWGKILDESRYNDR